VLAALALLLALRKSHRPELLGWAGAAAALGAAVAFLALGELSRRAAPATVAVAQVVDVAPGTGEAPVHGLLAVYRPDSGPVQVGAAEGGLFELDTAGAEGQTRRLVLTDLDAWHWEGLALPAGVRFAPFHYTTPTGGRVTAVAHFGPDGVEGKLTAGPFQSPADALLNTPAGRNIAVRLRPDGTFRAGTADVLPSGQFLNEAVLSDRQQRRQELYREFLKRSPNARPRDHNVLLTWADPVDMHFALAPEARTVGGALLVIPLRLEHPAAGGRVTVPGPLVPCRRVVPVGEVDPTLGAQLSADMDLRFRLPASVLPLKVERARLAARIDAPGRQVLITGRAADGLVELYRADSPRGAIRLDLTDERLLRLDDHGGLRLNLSVSEPLGGGGLDLGGLSQDRTWAIEYIELEVSGISQ
jgi:hypothetical protein